VASVHGSMVDCGTVTVVRPFEDNEVEVSDCSVSAGEITTQDSVSYTAVVRNRNGVQAVADVELRVDGSVVETKSVTIDGGTAESVNVEISLGQRGVGEYSLGAEVVSVTRAPGGDGANVARTVFTGPFGQEV